MNRDDCNPLVRVDLGIKEGFASFTNAGHPGNRIGYRFFEHSPMTWGEIPDSAGEVDRGRSRWEWERVGQERPSLAPARYRREIAGEVEGWTPQSWAYRLQPVDDGIEMLWTIRTREMGLPAYFGVQQCFRMSGRTNVEWRRKIALTPAFSEFDLWQDEGVDSPVASLTYLVRDREWHLLPASSETLGAPTTYGRPIDRARSGGHRPEVVGPYKATMLSSVDSGLITRTDRAGEWVCGIYWERTTHVTDHHPADCLHTIVNIGGIPPYSQRKIRGKIYWFKGSKIDLLKRWQSDFGSE